MNYIVFDLEFNQDYNLLDENKTEANTKNIFEIIQIGAVKLDEELQTTTIYNRLVKPQIYKTLDPFVEQMTGITMDMLSIAQPFEEIYKELIDFIGENSILCVWGMSDLKVLFENVQYFKLTSSFIPREYIDIQHHVSIYLNCLRKSKIGLRNAIEILNLPIALKFHDAANDAIYTAEIFRLIYTKHIKINFYHPTKNHRVKNINQKKQKLDSEQLIKQIEKMYNKELTLEEQSMIKLAYIMGKTNQFQIEIK